MKKLEEFCENGDLREFLVLLEGIQTMQDLVESTKSFMQKMRNGDLENFPNGMYWVTSLCGFGFNKVDFGWGKPTGTSHAVRSANAKAIVLMDTVDDDGIEAMVFLKK
ncbi:hypothetical protein R6Q59_012833 [Mikania micrantha]